MIPRDKLVPKDELDKAIEEIPFLFIGNETCECGINHTIYAPVPIGMAECVCGRWINFDLMEHSDIVL